MQFFYFTLDENLKYLDLCLFERLKNCLKIVKKTITMHVV